jgi:hypothetical protein
MIVELRTYHIQPGKMQVWLDHYEKAGLPLQLQYLGNLIGFFTGEIGSINQVKHLWAYASLAERESRRAALGKDPGWQDYRRNIPPVVLAQSSEILNPTAFSPLK